MDPLLNDLKFTFDNNDVNQDDDEEIYEALITKLENGDGVFNPDNLNPYGYGYNDPISFDDPDGRCPICVFVVAAFLYSEFANAPTGNAKKDASDYNNAKPLKTLASGAVLTGGAKKIVSAVKDEAIEKITEKTTEKKAPNPNGKNGGVAHQKTIDREEAKMKDEGFTETRREVKVNTPKGEKSKRYIDLEGKNPKTGETPLYEEFL